MTAFSVRDFLHERRLQSKSKSMECRRVEQEVEQMCSALISLSETCQIRNACDRIQKLQRSPVCKMLTYNMTPSYLSFCFLTFSGLDMADFVSKVVLWQLQSSFGFSQELSLATV